MPVTVLTPHIRRSDSRYGELNGVHILRYPYGGASNRPKYGISPFGVLTYNTNAFIYGLATTVRLRPKLLYANWVIPFGVVVYSISKLLGIPFLLHIHGTDFYEYGGFPFSLFWHLMLRDAVAVFSAGEGLKRMCERRFGREVQNAGVGVDTEAIERRRRKTGLRSELRIPGDALVCTFCGDVAVSKGVDVFCEAARRLVFRYTDFFFVIIGEGPLLKGISAYASERIRITGALPPEYALSYLVCSDIFVLPSRSEGLPVALVEALLAGCIPVVTGAGDCSILVEDGITGFLLREESISELVRCLLILRDGRIRRRMAETIEERRPYLYVFDAVRSWRRRMLDIVNSL